ncbi:Acyl-CoA-binding protein, ACBP [Cordyceps fumosorosea ARSEF 2679]|uniref:Acyl-CoA-binding protein, ACBP n=1 Tax=Cordyceps fumosorosea (strain ARSEF 2679) TaxID=1081104 RepID=A0A168AL65_CORFA|nr:Acyl-CoA-binding protein, ACBP [Cordyceps fumosorosea ARSEF 2679]OAA68901.1 Acyl-CoA-binding protein, ACBP [Cordyceps fumosorosea ARSEF 2679]
MSAAFNKAAEDSKQLTAKPSNDELLELYGLYKGKAKKNAWQKVIDEGISAEQAQERYVALVEQLKAKYGFDENKVPEAVGN